MLVALALVMYSVPREVRHFTLLSSTPTPEVPLADTEEFAFSRIPQDSIGSSSAGMAEAVFAVAPSPSLEPKPAKLEIDPNPLAVERVPLIEELEQATGPRFAENLALQGIATVGVVGTAGAIDRITHEILLSLEERPTLVVWLFDKSASLERQRAEIIERFDRIYEELGVIAASNDPAFKKHASKPLLSSVIEFGETVKFLIPQPTDDVEEIKSAVCGIKTDQSGIECTFQAVSQAIERFRRFRTRVPRRNVMLVIFTDEVGDDDTELDRTVAISRNLDIPVYCVGVPAPFGLRDASIKYVDPDPDYDQSVQWITIHQGPESFLPELVKIGDRGEEPLDSGFGPYNLTRLCYESGGIFFAVHPNRNQRGHVSRRDTAVLSAHLSYFFDPQIMRNYRPDYSSIKEYQRLLGSNSARLALVRASQLPWIRPMRRPTLVFPKKDDAELAKRLSLAQRAAAILEPEINQVHQLLAAGEKDRPKLTTPRWQAGYDLSFGRVLALKVRTESYNAMLAKAKQGMRFAVKKNDTWRLVPADEISVGSVLEKQAEQAKEYLNRVVEEHPGTPWALLASQELQEPIGWKWTETYTGVNKPRPPATNAPRQKSSEKKAMNSPRNKNRQTSKARDIRGEKPLRLPRPKRRPPPKL